MFFRHACFSTEAKLVRLGLSISAVLTSHHNIPPQHPTQLRNIKHSHDHSQTLGNTLRLYYIILLQLQLNHTIITLPRMQHSNTCDTFKTSTTAQICTSVGQGYQQLNPWIELFQTFSTLEFGCKASPLESRRRLRRIECCSVTPVL